MSNKIKAYLVSGYDIQDEEERMIIVYAETPSKAKSAAGSVSAFWYIPYMDLRAVREPCMDSQYQEGKKYLNWNNPKDRQILVKKLGWWCLDVDEYECQDCSARLDCSVYIDKQKEYDRLSREVEEDE